MFGKLSQRGFATLEVILMITVLGIISAIAIPRFSGITTSANTAKVQADLSTLDTAIAIYYMEKASYPSNISELKDYIQDVESLKPPTGNIYIDGDEKPITVTTYQLIDVSSDSTNSSTNNKEKRAAIDGNTAGHITKIKPNSNT